MPSKNAQSNDLFIFVGQKADLTAKKLVSDYTYTRSSRSVTPTTVESTDATDCSRSSSSTLSTETDYPSIQSTPSKTRYTIHGSTSVKPFASSVMSDCNTETSNIVEKHSVTIHRPEKDMMQDPSIDKEERPEYGEELSPKLTQVQTTTKSLQELTHTTTGVFLPGQDDGNEAQRVLTKLSVTLDRSRSSSSTGSYRDRHYPPISFPTNFNERVVQAPKHSTFLHSDRPNDSTAVTSPIRKLEIKTFTRPSATPRIIDSLRPEGEKSAHSTPTTKPPRASKSSVSQSQHKTISISQRTTSLPQLEVDYSFYLETHYFTECSHTTPPKNKPIDLRPSAETITSRSSHGGTITTTRPVFTSPCFDCDIFRRREREGDVIEEYYNLVSDLVDEMGDLLDQLEALNPSPVVPSGSDIDPMVARTAALNALTINEQPEATEHSPARPVHPAAARVAEIEYQIKRRTAERDDGVKNVWKGFSARWGPGALGVSHAPTSKRASVMSRASWMRGEKEADGSSGLGPVSPGEGVSKVITTELLAIDDAVPNRYRVAGDGTSVRNEDEGPVEKRTLPDGRMRIGWIRK